MTHEDILDEGLPFRPDFAARVLDKADAIVGRRRRARGTAAVVSAAIVAGLVTFSVWPAQPPGSERIPRQVASTGLGENYFARTAQMEPLDYMFPDAAPLAQFLDQYGGSDSAAEDDAVFFPDAKEVTTEEVDGS
jgi:hypothetical protein